MLPALVWIVLLGVAAAIAPLPVILAIALLGTRRPLANSLAYLLGGLLVYVALALAGSAVVVRLEESLGRRHHLSTPAFVLLAAIGALFLAVAIVLWRSERQVKIPARVDRILDAMSPLRAFAVGLLLCSPGLKNIALMVVTFGIIAAYHLDYVQAILASGLFLVITLIPPAAPVVVYLVLPRDRSAAVIQGWKASIDRHAKTILVIVSAAIGIILLQQGLSGLLS